jgi:predicted PurR-regulated permease PerM
MDQRFFQVFQGGFACLVVAGFVVLLFYPFWRIVQKAGYPGVMSLLLFIPVVNFIFLWVAALSDWPIEAQLRELRARAGVPATR